MTETKLADLVGLSEIAELYGTDVNAVNGWRRGKNWPDPVKRLRMGPMWDVNEVLAARPLPSNRKTEIILTCAQCGSDEWQGGSRLAMNDEEAVAMSLLCGDCGYLTKLTVSRSERTYTVTTERNEVEF